MSTDHFQTKYASFMEVLVKSTIAETTKLFETVVDELKTEISKLKAENEALKTTCRQKAEARTFAISDSGQSSLLTMRDSAVQCDRGQLFLFVEPVGQIMNQEGEQCQGEEVVYLLLNNHDSDAAKEGHSSPTVSLPNHEDSEPTVVSRSILCADPPPISACGSKTAGPETQQQCSNEELKKHHGTQVATVHPSLEEDRNLHVARNQSIEAVSYLNLLGTASDNMEAASDSAQALAALGAQELEPSQVRMTRLSGGETAVHEQNVQSTMPDRLPGEQIKCGVMDDETRWETEGQENKAGKNRKSVKCLPKSPKETLLFPSTVADGALPDDANGSSSSLTASSPQARPHPLRIHKSSVMLQDAMLLVEAMGQSKNRISAQENATAQGQCTPSVARSPLPHQAAAPQSPPTTNESHHGTEEESPSETAFDTRTTEPGNSQPLSRDSAVPQPKHGVEPSDMTPTSLSTAAVSNSLEQCAPHPGSVLAEPSDTTAGSDLVPQKIFVFSKTPSSNSQGMIAPLSPNQISAVVSTVAAAQNKSTLPASSSAGLPQRKNDAPLTTVYPFIMSKPTVSSTEQSPGPTPCKKITIIIRRTADVVANQSQLSEAQVAPTRPNSIGPAVTLSSRRPDVGAQVTSDEKETLLLTEQTPFILSLLSSTHPECPSRPPSSDCESSEIPRGEEAAAISAGSVPINSPLSSPQVDGSAQLTGLCESLERTPPQQAATLSTVNIPQKCFPLVPVIRLKRLSYPVLSTGSVLVSQLLSRERKSEVVPPDGTSSLVNDQAPKTMLHPSGAAASSSSACPKTKDVFVAQTSSVSSVSEKAVPSSALREAAAPALSPCAPSNASEPVSEKTVDFGETGLSAGSDQACKTVPLDEKGIKNAEKDLVSQNDFSNPLQSTPVTRDLSEPHLQLTKTEFLAQLAVMPVIQDAKKTSSSESADGQSSCEGPGPGRMSKSHRKSFFARLGVHLKTRSQARRAKTNARPLTEEMDIPERSTKKPRLENAGRNEHESTHKPRPLPTNTASSLRPSGSRTETEFSPASLGNRRRTNISSPESKTPFEPASVTPRKPIVSLYRLSLKDTIEPHAEIEEKCCIKQAPPAAVVTRQSSASKDEDGPNELKAATVCLKSNRVQNITTPSKTKFPAKSRKTSLSPKENASVEKIHANCPPGPSAHAKTFPSSLRMKSIGAHPPPRLTPVSQTDSSSIPNDPRPQPCHSNSIRNCIFSRGEKTSKQESDTFLRKTASPKWTENGAGSSKIEAGTAQKSSLNQKSPAEENNIKGQNAKKLAKAARSKEVGKDSQTKGMKMKQPINHHADDKRRNKYTSDTVCTPKVRARKAMRPEPRAAAPPMRHRSGNGKKLLKNQCEECGRVLSSSAALESHISLHTGHRPFCCTRCGKSFPDAKGLKRHGQVHCNGRLHICQQCGKGFVYGFGLNKHLQMVHGKRKPFVCQLCNKAFFTKRDVETHIRTHTGEKPFHCHLCEKKFVRSVELNAHLRWHRGEKRHWCPYCGKGFFDQNNLKRHKYIHTGEKPHSCPHCPKHFTQSG
uniref:Uncharacterized LOC109524532 n=2 Tax=Hippocampus comes TaxID=109280 RepID=A0A3Q3ECM7_HIPCM